MQIHHHNHHSDYHRHHDYHDHVHWHTRSVVEHEPVLGFSLTDGLGLVEYHIIIIIIMSIIVVDDGAEDDDNADSFSLSFEHMCTGLKDKQGLSTSA